MSVEQLEIQLDSFDPAKRKEALAKLSEMAAHGDVNLPDPGSYVNLHCHTFFSYNAYGYSPSKYAWLARKAGLALAGIVEFDVLDGLDEFIEAGRMLDLKVCVGLESRVFIPEFSTRVINSPGEPGISYHMGVGFPSTNLESDTDAFLQALRDTSADRNRALIDRVNRHLSPLELDYENDVLPLTPSGNATERHICLAYVQKAKSLFGDSEQLAAYWSEKLSTDASGLDLRVTHAGVVNETGKPYARERFVREAQTREVGDSVESANSRRPRTVIAVPRHPVAADLEAPGATGPGLRAERRERQPHFDREEATFAARCAGGLPLAVPTGVLGPTVEPGAARVHDELEVGLTAWSG